MGVKDVNELHAVLEVLEQRGLTPQWLGTTESNILHQLALKARGEQWSTPRGIAMSTRDVFIPRERIAKRARCSVSNINNSLGKLAKHDLDLRRPDVKAAPGTVTHYRLPSPRDYARAVGLRGEAIEQFAKEVAEQMIANEQDRV